MTLRFVLLVPFLTVFHANVFCQTDTVSNGKEAVIISRLSQEIDFDGLPNEEAWRTVSTIELIMHAPVFGMPPSEKSDVRIAFDDQYLYVGAWLMYEDPAMIRSASFKRDFIGQGSDLFGIILDTYNDKENAVMFITTPDALRMDAGIQRDALVNNSNKIPYNTSWNTFWDVKTVRSEQGWSVEMRIPISSMRFQKAGSIVKMGLTVQRWMPAKNEMNIFPAIPPNWGQYSILKPSQANEIILDNIEPQSPLYLTPYLLAGYGRYYNLSSNGEGYEPSDDPTFEAGLDIKYGITTNLVMDLTVNTDFAQVEADDQQINLSRFSLYFPEKRLFFLERSSAFDYNMGGNNNMFYSRRIGLSKDGRPVRIYGGVRLTGRLGKWDIGFLDMQTAPYSNASSDESELVSLPSENFAALRLRRQVINNNSYIGSMVTSRLGVNGDYNLVYGVDGIFRLFGEDYLDLKLARSSDSDLPDASLISPARLYTLWERRSKIGFGYAIGYSYVGTDYEPEMGFERLKDYGLYRVDMRYGWLSGPNSFLFRHSPEFEFRYFYYADDGTPMTYKTKAAWVFETKSKWMGELSAEYSIEHLKDTLFLQKDLVYVPPSDYNFLLYTIDLTTPDSKPFYINTLIETGSYFDGYRFSARLQPTWNISRHLEIGGTYGYDYVDFESRGQLIRNHIVGIKALFMFNTRLSFNGFIQYNTSENQYATNIRLRYNPREGNDLYLVFNEGRNSDLTREVPTLPVYNSRSIMLKYTYTFTF